MNAGNALRKAVSGLQLAVIFASIAWASPEADKTPVTTSLRWEEDRPGCTFSRDEDGKYRYGFWATDFGVILAVDSQELEKVRRRAEPLLALLLTIRDRGTHSFDIVPRKITLEFVKHSHDIHFVLDPDSLANNEQNDSTAFAEETERQIRKHPEKRAEKEAALAASQGDAVEMIEFLNTRTLRAATLDTGRPEASGWILFGVKSKWVDRLQKQEEFVLRVPLGERVVEFPFLLPPGEGDLILRRRPEN
jgi:hypothetical protein